MRTFWYAMAFIFGVYVVPHLVEHYLLVKTNPDVSETNIINPLLRDDE